MHRIYVLFVVIGAFLASGCRGTLDPLPANQVLAPTCGVEVVAYSTYDDRGCQYYGCPKVYNKIRLNNYAGASRWVTVCSGRRINTAAVKEALSKAEFDELTMIHKLDETAGYVVEAATIHLFDDTGKYLTVRAGSEAKTSDFIEDTCVIIEERVWARGHRNFDNIRIPAGMDVIVKVWDEDQILCNVKTFHLPN